MDATYSPEDNKLRLYPVSRLGKETYERVKAAGFKWAPKQELFVAPMWTPEREDLLIELCGEIGDEDTSLVERAEERSERFEDYSDKRERDAYQAKATVDAIADAIPFGQPILVGHHSERHARKHKEQIESGMRKAVKMWETSQYWADRAAGAIRHAKYKEIPSVRARRIKKIEADLRKQVKTKNEFDLLLKFWSKNPTKEVALKVCNGADHCGVTLPNGEKYWSAWSALEQDQITVEELTAQRVKGLPILLERVNRWIAHFENRLTYERAMLKESGGIVTDKVGPEKGGAVRCWSSPGFGKGWSYIKKVNKVSVTVEDNHGNGGKNFTRTMPFDKLKAVMTRAQVDEARASGRLVETAFKDGFFLHDTEPDPMPVVRKEPEAPTEFDAMKETLSNGGVKTVVAKNLFPTPSEIAKQVIELAEIQPGMKVLEPSAGTGNLLRAMGPLSNFEVVACEINPDLADELCRTWVSCLGVVCGDFIERFSLTDPIDDVGTVKPAMVQFDRVVMNPPFDRGLDIKHVEHALKLLKPGGKLVSIVANGPRQRAAFEPIATAWIDLPAGSFKDQGTNVNTAIVVIDKPDEKPEELPKPIPTPSAAQKTRKPRAKTPPPVVACPVCTSSAEQAKRFTVADFMNNMLAFLTAGCEHYEKTAPTVDDHLEDVYMRLINKGNAVSWYELVQVLQLRDYQSLEWEHPNYAANRIYKLRHELGMDITGHAGF
jgi:SAM-dependent methyltransferase